VDPLIYILVSGLIVNVCAPILRKLFNEFNFLDQDDWRKSDFRPIPLVGGTLIILFTPSLALIFAFLESKQVFGLNFFYLFVGCLIIYFLGLIDDIFNVRAGLKLLFQIIVALILVIGTDVHIESFQGLFGLEELPVLPHLLITGLLYLVFINMMNLIDGVDGLAAGIAIVATAFTTALAVYHNTQDLIIMCSVILGILLVFFRINHKSFEKKIYLGDNGSMLLGVVLTYFTLMGLNGFQISGATAAQQPLIMNPVFYMALFSYPLLDLIRVFAIRVFHGESPFKADRRHVHHRLADLGLSHLKISLIVIIYTTLISSFVLYLTPMMSINSLFLTAGLLACAIVYSPFVFKLNKNSWPHE